MKSANKKIIYNVLNRYSTNDLDLLIKIRFILSKIIYEKIIFVIINFTTDIFIKNCASIFTKFLKIYSFFCFRTKMKSIELLTLCLILPLSIVIAIPNSRE